MTVRLFLLAGVLASPGASVRAAAPDDAPAAVVATPPQTLAERSGERLGPPFADENVPIEPAPVDRRRAAAAAWLREALAPLAAPQCAGLSALDLDEAVAGWAQLYPAERPVAGAGRPPPLLVPTEPVVMDEATSEHLMTTGLLPVEIALAGEWARALAAQHVGPPPADPLLRQARAARLEGIARLAAVHVTFAAQGIDPADLGPLLLDADSDKASWRREELLAAARSPLARAALLVYLEDGFRWAAFHYLRGGLTGVLAAAERPGVGPEDLLRPGLRGREPDLGAGGCRLGPRLTATLLAGESDPVWVDRVLGSSWSRDADGNGTGVRVELEDEAAATALAEAMRARGWQVRRAGVRLVGRSPSLER